jgi:hypothetical protein
MPPELRAGTCVSSATPDLWSATATQPAHRARALALCESCPVLTVCRAWSLSIRTADDLGVILGAMTPEDRALVRRRRQRALRKATA